MSARTVFSLRMQFSIVIFLLGFLPNVGILFYSPPDNIKLAWAWIVIVGLISGMIGYFLSGVLLRPLQRLEKEIRYNDFQPAHSDDPAEILLLRTAFRDLLNKLNTEQTRRNAFMATLVHDLKTPLIASSHLVKILADSHIPSKDRLYIVEQIESENQRLLTLVQQMNDAHRCEREDFKLSLSVSSLRPVIENVFRRLEMSARKRGIHLSIIGSGTAAIDPIALERAINNLADNALRYADGCVLLLIIKNHIFVIDDGPGIEGKLEDLAQPFNAQPTLIAGQHYTAGTAGLGLYIVLKIVQAHGGNLKYQRQSLYDLEQQYEEAFPELGEFRLHKEVSMFRIELAEVCA